MVPSGPRAGLACLPPGVGGNAAGLIHNQLVCYVEIQPLGQTGRMCNRCALDQLDGFEGVQAVDRNRGAENADILSIVRGVAHGKSFSRRENRVGIVGLKAKRVDIIRVLARQAVLVLIHQVAGQVGDVRTDRQAVLAAGSLCGEGDLILIPAQQRDARSRNRPVGRYDGDVIGCKAPAPAGIEVDRLTERDGGGIQRIAPQVHRQRRS